MSAAEAASAVDAVTLQVRALEQMPLEDLRAEWRRRIGPAPKLRSPDMLRRVLAWRIQTQAWAGSTPPLRRRLRESAPPRGGVVLSPGAEVSREWEGAAHRVQVLESGFLYEGLTYRSLSAVALHITGVRWNGPRFFGLRPGGGVSAPVRRCAIYTRKSSDESLDQAFNSLHAQREACEAYVKSQKGEGWRCLRDVYDDGGVSGGTMERPALKRLLAEVAAGRIDVVVVYKVDRLTRSLADFAKMVELFDAQDTSFVSVTQAFNTTSSMGRLTLNVLLSFAQFEREVTGERIRDKLAASKAKGMWMGGLPPLGYAPDPTPGARTLVVVPDEAELVRRIFSRYLELASVNALGHELDAQGIVSKVWVTQKGRRLGGLPFSRGALFHLLKNPIYAGDIVHRDQRHPGLHPAILARELFDEVQAHLTDHAPKTRRRLSRVAAAPLKGRIFDALGRPMSPVFTRAHERINRYYVSAPVQQGRRAARDENVVTRIPAHEVEGFVLDRLRTLHRAGGPDAGWEELNAALLRVELSSDSVRMDIAPDAVLREGCDPEAERSRLALPASDRLTLAPCGDRLQLVSAVRLKRRGGRTTLRLPEGASAPVRASPDVTLIAGLRRGHALAKRHDLKLDRIQAGAAPTSPEDRYAQRLIAMAFLAPDLQADILAGRHPAGLSLQQLILSPTPLAWADQRDHLRALARD